MKVFTPDDIFGMKFPKHPTTKWYFGEMNRHLALAENNTDELTIELNGATTGLVIPKKAWKKFGKKAKKSGWKVKLIGNPPECMELSSNKYSDCKKQKS